MLAEVTVPDQGAAKKMTPGRCTKKIHPESPEVTFSGNRYIICPKPPSPAGKGDCSSKPYHPSLL